LEHSDPFYMSLALEQAQLARVSGEVPVGAVVVKDGKVIGVGHNACIAHSDPSAHAEIVALRSAALSESNYRLDGCEIFVTLEPCAMCAGAILQARLGRVVFGASDAKAGASGSVVNLFTLPALNHHTQVHRGVLEEECSLSLQSFFAARRHERRQHAVPLREDALRTPNSRFDGLLQYPWMPRYTQSLPVLAGLRMHYLDEGPQSAQMTFLCLHGNGKWSYLFRQIIPAWASAGYRVIAPDFIGFGKSDKPKRKEFHSYAFHQQSVIELVESLDLNNIVLVTYDWTDKLALTLPAFLSSRLHGLIVLEREIECFGDTPKRRGKVHQGKGQFYQEGTTLAKRHDGFESSEVLAYEAPFPDAGHHAGVIAMSEMTSDSTRSPDYNLMLQGAHFWESLHSSDVMLRSVSHSVANPFDSNLAQSALDFFTLTK
jgi:tRNA(adenine34) deaminase